MSFARVICICVLSLLFCGGMQSSTGAQTAGQSVTTSITPSDVYRKVQSLNQGMVLLLRKQSGQLDDIHLNTALFESPISPRHVYQRVLDLEQKLVGLMRLNSLNVEETSRVEIRQYEPAHVYGLVENIADVIESLLVANGIDVPLERSVNGSKVPKDVYFLLERMEGLLLKMGAPSTQLYHFMRRARALSVMASRICQMPYCARIQRNALAGDQVLTPVDIYLEVYRFIHAMDEYAQKRKLQVPGGILALSKRTNIVSPSDINSLLGVALADFVAVIDQMGQFNVLDLEPYQLNVGPKEVWSEIHYARLLLEAMTRH